MRWMRGALLLIAVVALSAVPAVASPAVLALPGHSGASQYFETIPTSAGNAAPPGSVKGSGSGTAPPSALSHFGKGATGAGRLAQLGKNGSAAEALAAATAPSLPQGLSPAAAKAIAAGSPSAGGGSRSAGGGSRSAGGGGSVISGISHALDASDTGGLGIALPLLLATVLVVIVGFTGLRLLSTRHRQQPGS